MWSFIWRTYSIEFDTWRDFVILIVVLDTTISHAAIHVAMAWTRPLHPWYGRKMYGYNYTNSLSEELISMFPRRLIPYKPCFGVDIVCSSLINIGSPQHTQRLATSSFTGWWSGSFTPTYFIYVWGSLLQDQSTYNLAGFQGRPARSRYPSDTHIDRSLGDFRKTNRKAERETGLVLNYHLFYFGAEVVLYAWVC